MVKQWSNYSGTKDGKQLEYECIQYLRIFRSSVFTSEQDTVSEHIPLWKFTILMLTTKKNFLVKSDNVHNKYKNTKQKLNITTHRKSECTKQHTRQSPNEILWK